MDTRMATVMANHATILSNQDYVITQLSHQHDCTEGLKREVENMRQVVEDVRAIMTTFKVIGWFAKYGVVVGGAATAAYHGVKAAITFGK